MRDEPRILQIIPLQRRILACHPAPGWWAVYKEDDGALFKAPLSCWALVERDDGGEPFNYIDAFEMGGEGADGQTFCSDVKNFSHYEHEGSAHAPRDDT